MARMSGRSQTGEYARLSHSSAPRVSENPALRGRWRPSPSPGRESQWATPMRLLVIGSGGREHALVWRLSRDADVTGLVCAPGNPGIARLARCVDLRPTDLDGVVRARARRSRSTSRSSGRSCPWPRASPTGSRRRDSPLLGPRRRPRNSRPARCSRRPSWPATVSRPRATDRASHRRPRGGPSRNSGCPSSSRRTDLPPGRAW